MINDNSIPGSKNTSGYIYGVLAYGIWGFLPLYWKTLDNVSAGEILAHRIFWAMVFMFVVAAIGRNFKVISSVLKRKRNIILIIFSSILIGLNWGEYIWAVNSGHIVECSMGYFINPLMMTILGLTALKEKVGRVQYVSIFLAFAGVMVITIEFGRIPWIALTLALTFALYGLVKRIAQIDATAGQTIETAILAPITLAYIFYRQINGIGALGSISTVETILLFCSGIATAVPLLFFSKAALRLELTSLAFLQYISPSLMLIIGTLVYHEPFTPVHLVSFGLIWSSLAIYTLSKLKVYKTPSIAD